MCPFTSLFHNDQVHTLGYTGRNDSKRTEWVWGGWVWVWMKCVGDSEDRDRGVGTGVNTTKLSETL
jgi:hypothetical protein